MTTNLDELGTRAAEALDRGARGVAEPPPAAELRRRWQRRQRRRVAFGAVGAVTVLAIAVAAVPEMRPWAPEIVNQPTDGAASPSPSASSPVVPSPSVSTSEPAGEVVTAGGWTMTSAGEVFNETHGLVFAGTQLEDRTVLVGTDDSRGSGLVAPAVWLGGDDEGWRRVPLDQIDLGGSRYETAELLMTDVAASDDGRLVTVGYANFEPREEPVVWLSTDRGESWTMFEDLGGRGDASVHSVAWGSRGFVMVGARDGLASAWWQADDGWVEAPTDEDGSFVAVAPLYGGGYIATTVVGDSSGAYVTGDVSPGAALPTWEPVTPPGFETSSLLAHSGVVFATGTHRPEGSDFDGAVAMTEDGVEWETYEGYRGLGGVGDQFVYHLIFGPDGVGTAAGSDVGDAIVWSLTIDGWQSVPRELFPAGSSTGPIVISAAGDPVVFGVVPRGGTNEVVTWQRIPRPASVLTPRAVLENGPEHCMWDRTQFLYLEGPLFDGDEGEARHYVSYPERVGLQDLVEGAFDDDAALPETAQPTGLSVTAAEIWVVPELADEAAFLVFADHVERWPAFRGGCA